MLLKSMPSSSFALSFLFLTSLISENAVIKRLSTLIHIHMLVGIKLHLHQVLCHMINNIRI
jgi:hypothetical protein